MGVYPDSLIIDLAQPSGKQICKVKLTHLTSTRRLWMNSATGVVMKSLIVEITYHQKKMSRNNYQKKDRRGEKI